MTVNDGGQIRMNVAAPNAGRGIMPNPGAYGATASQAARIQANNAQNARAQSTKAQTGAGADFAKILENTVRSGGSTGLKISKHAEARLFDREIQLSGAQREKIADALVKAGNKGVRDALVMLDGLAIVANTKSMTVITAVNKEDLQDNIFTNIDGAVFA